MSEASEPARGPDEIEREFTEWAAAQGARAAREGRGAPAGPPAALAASARESAAALCLRLAACGPLDPYGEAAVAADLELAGAYLRSAARRLAALSSQAHQGGN